MFDNQSAVSEKQTLLEGVTGQLYNLLNTQESTINSIENKLHKIVDKQVQSKGETNVPSGLRDKEPDWSFRINAEVTRVVNNNIRLEQILKHFSEIV